MNSEIITSPILLIEDNPLDADLAVRALRRRKLVNTIEIARDGQEALDLVAGWRAGEPRPLVVLLDLNLPKVSGLDVLLDIKSDSATRSVPVVVLTTSREDSDIQTAYDRGANSYIVKPVDFDKFVTVAEQIEIYWCALNEPPRPR